jgi:hypothetical protein
VTRIELGRELGLKVESLGGSPFGGRLSCAHIRAMAHGCWRLMLATSRMGWPLLLLRGCAPRRAGP